MRHTPGQNPGQNRGRHRKGSVRRAQLVADGRARAKRRRPQRAPSTGKVCRVFLWTPLEREPHGYVLQDVAPGFVASERRPWQWRYEPSAEYRAGVVAEAEQRMGERRK